MALWRHTLDEDSLLVLAASEDKEASPAFPPSSTYPWHALPLPRVAILTFLKKSLCLFFEGFRNPKVVNIK